ncbi:FAD-dependent monooxygenase [Pedobacter jeongneungensis]|uniref:FAD-dependent monooxygenase n=1 Tax=Pedobacter jeongneungensis TaxID=947309 RepID=UPI00046A6AC0|nr:FAD-dependent monooxygenase [Pedobacter jeongneungensis]
MINRKILISGASIAGLTAAYWLEHYGFAVTVVERNQELRLGGQNIDVKGPAWEIIKKMQLEEKIRKANTTEVGIRFVDINDLTVAEFPKDDALSMTQELEILRGDLVKILYDKVKNKATIRFGNYIQVIEDRGDRVAVNFADDLSETFDAVIIAEGIGSSTRRKVFGNEVQFRYLGLYTSYFTATKTDTDSNWARWCNAKGGIVFLLRPDNYGTTRACINFRSPEMGYEKLPSDQQKNLLIKKIQYSGWEGPRLIQEIMNSDDLYLERLSQVLAPRWHKGRVAMIGDAAYCVTPIGGKGTDLAISGAYIIAGELCRAEHNEAFVAYEKRLRPFVAKVQKLPPGVPRLVYPKTTWGVAVLNSLFRVVGSRPAKMVMGLFSNNKKHPESELHLPDYNV